MSKFTKILFFLVLICSVSFAQMDTVTIISNNNSKLDKPQSQSTPPLFIVSYKGKEYVLDSVGVKENVFNPKFAQSMNVIKSPERLIPYGEKAKHGVILVLLKDQKELFLALKKHLKPFK